MQLTRAPCTLPLHRFTIGEAVRHARLKLLKAGNPLGLVYVPFLRTFVHRRSPSASSSFRRENKFELER
jgi:hypothetical protein